MLIIGPKLLFQYWKIQIFSFMEEKCSSVCSYDKNIVTFWQKRTFTLKVNVLSAWCLHGFNMLSIIYEQFSFGPGKVSPV